VRDIGHAAGLTQGTIYNYVRSKEDILFLVCDRVIAEYISSMEEAAAATGDPAARLREALRGVTRVMIEQSSAILLVYHESHNLDRRSLRSLLTRVQGWINQFEELVAEGLGRERLPKTKRSLLTNIVTFLPTLIALRGWSLPKDLTHDQYTEGLVEFMMRGLGLDRELQILAVGIIDVGNARPVIEHAAERRRAWPSIQHAAGLVGKRRRIDLMPAPGVGGPGGGETEGEDENHKNESQHDSARS